MKRVACESWLGRDGSAHFRRREFVGLVRMADVAGERAVGWSVPRDADREAATQLVGSLLRARCSSGTWRESTWTARASSSSPSP